MTHTETRTQILTALVQATDLPVDAKIRLLPLPPKGSSNSASAAAAAAASLATPVATPPPATDPAQQPQRTPSAILEPTIPPTLTVNADADAATSDTEATAAGPLSRGEEEEEEPTLALVARIFDTGIANLTVHCRTQEMRSREPALHERMRGITEMGRQKGVPVVCNGDAVGGGKDAGWGNFDQVCEKTGTFEQGLQVFSNTWCSFDNLFCSFLLLPATVGVSSVMIARAAEANPSCFSRSGLADPISEVIPKLLRVVSKLKPFILSRVHLCPLHQLTDERKTRDASPPSRP